MEDSMAALQTSTMIQAVLTLLTADQPRREASSCVSKTSVSTHLLHAEIIWQPNTTITAYGMKQKYRKKMDSACQELKARNIEILIPFRRNMMLPFSWIDFSAKEGQTFCIYYSVRFRRRQEWAACASRIPFVQTDRREHCFSVASDLR